MVRLAPVLLLVWACANWTPQCASQTPGTTTQPSNLREQIAQFILGPWSQIDRLFRLSNFTAMSPPVSPLMQPAEEQANPRVDNGNIVIVPEPARTTSNLGLVITVTIVALVCFIVASTSALVCWRKARHRLIRRQSQSDVTDSSLSYSQLVAGQTDWI